jgi:hypothetical protein
MVEPFRWFAEAREWTRWDTVTCPELACVLLRGENRRVRQHSGMTPERGSSGRPKVLVEADVDDTRRVRRLGSLAVWFVAAGLVEA